MAATLEELAEIVKGLQEKLEEVVVRVGDIEDASAGQIDMGTLDSKIKGDRKDD